MERRKSAIMTPIKRAKGTWGTEEAEREHEPWVACDPRLRIAGGRVSVSLTAHAREIVDGKGDEPSRFGMGPVALVCLGALGRWSGSAARRLRPLNRLSGHWHPGTVERVELRLHSACPNLGPDLTSASQPNADKTEETLFTTSLESLLSLSLPSSFELSWPSPTRVRQQTLGVGRHFDTRNFARILSATPSDLGWASEPLPLFSFSLQSGADDWNWSHVAEHEQNALGRVPDIRPSARNEKQAGQTRQYG
ncbi:hypothetical protein B0T17DRAFT_260483 [Bombardia bombarda]|uniref:Uncharacterized protein n=1 Tax=Bombardia bombarda TaxID=252184 RepID=A0AA39X1D8_9PEZI|nr:hypothetical protein B0T17DRAFT_260483 [Bombardia bombarda]